MTTQGYPTALVLSEYATERCRLADDQARALASTRRLSVTPDPEPGWWQVTAGDHVGSIVVDGFQVLVRPKIKLENLFLLLEVGLDERAWRREAFDYATRADLLPAVISFFARTVETTLARGVLRSYREQLEPLVAMRGRIDIRAQINRSGLALPVVCRYEDYTADIVENRYVKTAVHRALRVARVPAEDRHRLRQQLVALEEVDDAPLAADAVDRVSITRLNAHYEPALRLARLLLENLTLADQQGHTSGPSFMVDMNKLFESFVTQRLRRALAGRLEVRAQAPVHLGEGRQVVMYPDLVFRQRGRTVYAADIKYKLTSDARARNSDYYQLLAYTTALELPEGVLIYCLADGGRPSSEVSVRHAGKVLHTRALDLTGAPAAVAAEIESLADWIVGRLVPGST